MIYINIIFTNNRVLDPKTTRDLFAVRLEVNEQLIPAGCDVSLQIAATECLDQVTCSVSSVINLDFVATTRAFWEVEADEVQANAL